MKAGDYVHQKAGVGLRSGKVDNLEHEKVFVKWVGATRALPYTADRFRPIGDRVWELTTPANSHAQSA